MTIKTVVESTPQPSHDGQFPALRQCVASNTGTPTGLVVLFLSGHQGIALAGVDDYRIGRVETWRDITDACWAKTSLTLTSES